jgi:transcriptional regulator with XRE-family HTH domain
MNDLIVQKIKEARKERGLTQQDLANYLGKTSAAISELERGKVQVSAGDLYQLAQLLTKPIEYFYGIESGDKEIQDIIGLIRRMPPEARKQQLPMIAMMLQMLDIGQEVKETEDEAQQLELAKEFYNLFLPYSTMMNKWIAQMNEIRLNLESLLGIKNTDEQ